jgi:hypothetical protein
MKLGDGKITKGGQGGREGEREEIHWT